MRRYPSAKDLAKITKPGRYAVGHGAYLQIANGGTRSWLFRYRVNDKQHHMGLGSCEYVSLQEARQRAWEAQRQRLNGVDPRVCPPQRRRRLPKPRVNIWLPTKRVGAATAACGSGSIA